ncbi:MAG: hypothetical protein WBM78_23605, partial [Desulfobacterales bacterium]
MADKADSRYPSVTVGAQMVAVENNDAEPGLRTSCCSSRTNLISVAAKTGFSVFTLLDQALMIFIKEASCMSLSDSSSTKITLSSFSTILA